MTLDVYRRTAKQAAVLRAAAAYVARYDAARRGVEADDAAAAAGHLAHLRQLTRAMLYEAGFDPAVFPAEEEEVRP